MIENAAHLLMQYGVLGVWTATLLWERAMQRKQAKAERSKHVHIITKVSTNMALVNDNLKDLKSKIDKCPNNRG